MKARIYILTLTSLWAAGLMPFAAQLNGQDSTTIQPAHPDSLRVTVDPGVFRWRRLSYEAEVRVSALYPPGEESNAPENLRVLIDLESRGATFWTASNDEEGKYTKSDYLVLRRDQLQARGLVRWMSGNPVKLTAKLNGIKVTKVASVFIPMLLFILCLAGAAIGGWLRCYWNPEQKTKTSRSHSKKWRQRLEKLKEIAVGMVAGILLYLLNLISPLYLEFRPVLGAAWLGLAQPLVIGFIGGWGGISLLVNLLQWISKEKAASIPATVEAASAQKNG